MLQVFALNAANAEVEVTWAFGPIVHAGWVQREAFQAGARAYVLKGNAHHQLLDAIRAVQAGRKWIAPERRSVIWWPRNRGRKERAA